jgi:membrane-bound lytic murein transglycosylase D
MRGTAVENGLRHDWYVDERAEPERATVAAARYLKTLHDMFGDWHLALASYNGGPGRVQRAMKRSGKADFWSLSANRRFLPRETRDYVPLILAAAVVGRNPEQYGLTITPQTFEAPASETVTLTSPVDLRRLADAIERPLDELKALNPALRRWATPPGTDRYELRIPAGTAEKAAEFLASMDAEADSPYRWHTAKKGETVAAVAKRLNVTRRDLLDANFLKTGARLRPGQRLIVPKDPTVLAARATRTADAPVAAVNTSAKRPATVPASVSRAHARKPANRRTAASAAGPVVHRVKRGETLGSIARRYRTTVADIRRWNDVSGSAIKTGQRLTIRPRAAD